VGILPLVSARHVSFLQNEVPGYPSLKKHAGAWRQPGGRAKVGVELAAALVTAVKSWAQGVYLMPQFSRYDLIAEIIEAVQ